MTPGFPIDDATIIARSATAPAVPVERGLVIMSIQQGSYLRLDAIGADVWARIEQPCAFADLVDRLAAAYDAPRDTIAADVRAWLGRMAEAQVIELS